MVVAEAVPDMTGSLEGYLSAVHPLLDASVVEALKVCLLLALSLMTADSNAVYRKQASVPFRCCFRWRRQNLLVLLKHLKKAMLPLFKG